MKSKMTDVLNQYQGYSTTHEISVGWNLLFIGVRTTKLVQAMRKGTLSCAVNKSSKAYSQPLNKDTDVALCLKNSVYLVSGAPRCFRYFQKTGSPSHNISVAKYLKNVTLQIYIDEWS